MTNKSRISSQYPILRLTANVLAVGITSFKGNRGGKPLLIYKITYSICLCICFLLLLSDEESLWIGYSILATAGILLQIHTMLVFNVLIVMSTTYWLRDNYKFYEELDKIRNSLEKRFQKSVTLYRPVNLYLVAVLITCPMLAISDLFLKEQFISIPFWVGTHIPGITLVTYINHINALLKACANAFEVLNGYLEGFTLSHLNTMESISVSFQNTVPNALINKSNEKSTANLLQVFAMHSRISALVKKINGIVGINLLGLILVGGGNFLCLIYNVTMYFVVQVQVRKTQWCTLYSQDYWSVVYFGAVIAIVTTSQKLKNSAYRIGVILHKLRNLYPDLGEEWVNIYSMQLLNEGVEITAANVFVFSGDFFPSAIAAMTTLVAIALQYDENYLLAPPKYYLALANEANNVTGV